MDERIASESCTIGRDEPLLRSRMIGGPVVAGESEDDCQQLGGHIGERSHASQSSERREMKAECRTKWGALQFVINHYNA